MEYLCILNAYEQAFRMQDIYIEKMNNDCRLWQPWKDFSRKEETRLTTKELPTAKWRRDRRLRTIDYQQATTKHTVSSLSSSLSSPSSSSSSSSTTTPCSSPSTPPLSPSQHSLPCNVAKPLNETTNTTSVVATSPIFAGNALSSAECPIDMSVTSTTIKPRTPPPPYREPLPGSTFATLARPSVITQAPPKRSDNHHSHHHHRDYDNSISNRENDNRSNESISMCDPVIDEHFRRSLGADYMALFNKKSPSPQQQQQQQQPNSNSNSDSAAISPNPNNSRTTITTVTNNESISSSVDDHFAKALGDTWKKLQAADKDLKITDNNRSITSDIKNLNKINREK